MSDVVTGTLAMIGAVFVLFAGIGVLRFPDVYTRMHAATKATAIGIALISIATTIAVEGGRAKTLAAVAFTFLTAPSAAHFVGRAAYRAEGISIELAGPDELATLSDDEEGAPRS